MASAGWRDATTNQKLTVSLGYCRGRRRTGRTLSQLFGNWILRQKNKYNEICRGFWRTPIDDGTQKPTGEGLGEDARMAGNAGERYLIILGAIEVGGGRK
jgi:hypothetical protein